MMWDFLIDASLFNSSPTMKVLHGLIVATLQGTLLLGIAYALALLMQRASAAQRQWVWLLALTGMLVLPLVSNVIPRRLVLVPAQPTPELETLHFGSETFASTNSNSLPSSSDTNATAALTLATVTLDDIVTQARNAWPLGVLCCWLVGASVLALRLGMGLRNIRRLERASVLIQDGLWIEQANETAQQLQIKRPVSIRVAPMDSSLVVPVTWGWRKPVILVPHSSEAWSPGKRRAVLLHEMAHIAHGDWAAFWVAHIACSFYWFHPLVWFAARALQAEGERAADDRVLALGLRAGDYAECLMEFVNSLTVPRQKSLTLSIGMARSSTLGNRLIALLDATRNRRRPTRIQVLSCVAVTSVCLLLVATIGVTDEKLPVPESSTAKRTVTVKGRILDTNRQPVANARISVYDTFAIDSTPVQTTKSDVRGAYEVKVPDEYETYRLVQIEKPGFGVKVATAYGELAKSPHDWILPKPTSLSGVVADENGNPLAGARVAAVSFIENRYHMGSVHGLETRTDANGRWTLNRLPVGASSDIEIVAPRFARQRFTVAIEAKSAPVPPVKLQPGFDAMGRVLDADGNPVHRAQISLSQGGQVSTLTAQDGTFTLPGLALQDQEITISTEIRDQFAPQGLRVSPTRQQVEVRLEKGVTIRGRLIDAGTKAPIAGVRVSDQWGTSNDTDTSDALGQFEIVLPSRESGSLTFQKPSYQYRYIFLSADQMARQDTGDVQLARGTIWRGKVRVNGAVPAERVFLNLQSAAGNAQLSTDKDGNFQVNSLPSGTYTWSSDLWKWKPVSPRQISIPAPQNAPFVLDVNVQLLPTVSARGRVVDEKGKPLAYALVALQEDKTTQPGQNKGDDTSVYSTRTRADGTWERKDLPFGRTMKIQRVEYQEITLRNLQSAGRKVGARWQFPTVAVNTKANQTRLRVVDSKGKSASGARVLALWNNTVKFVQTDSQGNATFQIAPQKVRFLAAKGLEYGEAALNGSPRSTTIHLRAPENALPKAEAIVDAHIEYVFSIPNAELIGDQRWRAAALKADKATTDWDMAGENFGRYLSSLVYNNPKQALAQAPIWLERIKKPETTRPFFLRLAEANFALLAAKSKNQTAKAWANRWLDRQIANFNARLLLKPRWAGGDQVSRYLQGYAVAKALGRPEADRFFAKALEVLPKEQSNPGSYSFPEYFTIDDPRAIQFRDQLVVEDQVNFQGALGSVAVRENPANGERATQALEKLLREPSIAAVGIETKRFARRRIASEILAAQIKSLGQKTSHETPRSAFEKLKAFDGTSYYMGGLALSLTGRALERGDRALAREILDLVLARGWDQIEHKGDWTRLRAQLAPAATAAQIGLWRAEAIANLKNGDPMHGNMAPDLGADARRLRFADPAFGRILLEAKWTRLRPLTTDRALDNRFEAIALAVAMADYDPARALHWFERIPRGGQFDPTDNKMELAVKIVGESAKGKLRKSRSITIAN